MADQQLSREEQLLAFFVNHCEGKLGRTQLMKFLYLADYEARRYLGKPISDIEYKWHHYGPYDDGLPAWIQTLEELDIVKEREIEYPTGTGFLYSRGTQDVAYGFDADELVILQYVCRTYSQVSLQRLLAEVVYATEPMKKAKESDARGRALDMAVVDNTKRSEMGIAFDELLARSRRAMAGAVVSWEEAMNQLKARVPAVASA